ncbi:MAG: cytochrome c oxidase subunit 3 [Acidobacteriaceae bacterium]
MPAIITRAPAEVERKDTGIGGRPPLRPRPTGGGGGDENWERRPPGRRGPRELLTRYRMGLGFALAGDLIFFAFFVLAFYVPRQAAPIDPASQYILDWRPLMLPPILWIDTAILLLSSLTIEMARRSMFHELHVMEEWLGLGRPTTRRALPWLIATALLGALFIAGQWVAWTQLTAEGVYFASSPSSHFFYLITGAHALHLVLGVAAIAAALVALRSASRMEVRQIVVDSAAWYWHFMGVLWLMLFGLLLLAH